MILTLLKTIPSTSHNAPFSAELGNHWPAGQRFKTFSAKREANLRRFYRIPDTSVVLQQIGGEEVLLVVSAAEFSNLFD